MRAVKYISTIFSACVVLGIISGCQEQQKPTVAAATDGAEDPLSVVVIGDSINRGLFADRNMGDDVDVLELWSLTQIYQTSGLAGVDEKYAIPEYNGYTGADAEEPLTTRLYGTRQPEIIDYSISGDSVGSFESRSAEEDADEGVDEVLFTLGNNDFCQLSLVDGIDNEAVFDTFQEKLTTALKQVVSRYPNADINISGPLPIHSLNQFKNEEGGICALSYSYVCPNITVSEADKAWQSFNQAFQRGVITAAARHRGTDIYFSDLSDFGDSLKKENLALDCFHPNKAGHNALAEAVANQRKLVKPQIRFMTRKHYNGDLVGAALAADLSLDPELPAGIAAANALCEHNGLEYGFGHGEYKAIMGVEDETGLNTVAARFKEIEGVSSPSITFSQFFSNGEYSMEPRVGTHGHDNVVFGSEFHDRGSQGSGELLMLGQVPGSEAPSSSRIWVGAVSQGDIAKQEATCNGFTSDHADGGDASVNGGRGGIGLFMGGGKGFYLSCGSFRKIGCQFSP